MTPGRVVVVGGGLAGVAAALHAADQGADVVVVERRGVLGGLTSSIERDGHTFDNGQHVFLRCCTAYRALLTRLGAVEQVHLQDRCDVPVLSPDGTRASIRRTALPAPLHLAGSLARYAHLSLADRARLVRAALALRRLDPADPRLDAETFGSWLTRHGQSAAAIDRLWNLIALPTLNLPASEASLLLATKVFREGLLDATDAGDVGWSLVPLRELHGTNALRALKDAGVDVRLATKVTSIDDGGGRLVAQTPDGGVDADAVVVATPPAVAASLGALRPASVAARLGTSPIVNVHLLFDRRVTEHTMFATVDSPLQFVFDRSATCGLTEGQCLSVSLSAADAYLQVGATELAETCVAALHALLPAARQATLVDAVVTREHAATFRGVPGTDALRPGPITSRRGVLLAGAWCATGWPATMEGAVRSGHAAASAALDVAAGATPLELTGDLTGDLTGGAPTTVGRVAS